MTHDSLLAMASVIQLCPEHHVEVLSVRQGVTWPDESTVDLRPVKQRGGYAVLLRAVHHNGTWTVFDLAHVIPHDVEDVKAAYYRDQVGLVMYALRRRFHNAPAFLARMDRHALAKWQGPDAPCTPRPELVAPANQPRVGRRTNPQIFTTGSGHFLQEPTGSRRFWPVKA